MVPAIFTVYLSACREFRLHRWLFIGLPSVPFSSADFLREIGCFHLHRPISWRKFAVSVCISRFPAGNLLFPFASADFLREIGCFHLHRFLTEITDFNAVCVRHVLRILVIALLIWLMLLACWLRCFL